MTLKPGRELDAKVAEAMGWQAVTVHDGVGGSGFPPPGNTWRVIPRYSTCTADAIAALEATGESWTLCLWPDMHEAEENGTPYRVVIMPKNPTVCAGCGHQKRTDIEEYGDTICTAVCAAILAWAEAKGA